MATGSGTESSNENSFFSRIKSKLKPLNQHNLYTYYIPLAGAVSYSALSLKAFLPNASSRALGTYSVKISEILLLNTHLGTGFYLFNSKHLSVTPMYQRIMYSVYSSMIFNFGSILLWAVIGIVLPDSHPVRAIFAVSSSLTMLSIGKDYIDYVDGRISGRGT